MGNPAAVYSLFSGTTGSAGLGDLTGAFAGRGDPLPPFPPFLLFEPFGAILLCGDEEDTGEGEGRTGGAACSDLNSELNHVFIH
jgi:hypothetical protein